MVRPSIIILPIYPTDVNSGAAKMSGDKMEGKGYVIGLVLYNKTPSLCAMLKAFIFESAA